MKAELNLPAGFRFHPTDEELVKYYLCRKSTAQPITVPVIAEIDLYKFDPWDLPGMALYGEKEWYFFSPRDRKYPNGSRPNRAAGTGYWKATGADKPVGKPRTLGIKKALVFYAGKAPKGVKTTWIMHEYRLAGVDRSASVNKKNNLRLDDWVLCRIYNKKGAMEKPYPESTATEGQSPFDTSYSSPTPQEDDSTSSGHVISPDVTCDNREVLGELDFDFDLVESSLDESLFGSMEFLQNDAFVPRLHDSTFLNWGFAPQG